MGSERFGDGEFYHVCNRGVDKRDVFLDSRDFDRFLQGLDEFNTREPLGGLYARSLIEFPKRRRPTSKIDYEKLVDIVCYCLNPNHFHLLLRQLVDGGVSEFLKRLGGYTKYFNHRYKRSGVLFQGKSKTVHVVSNEQLLHTSAYINLNGLVHRLKKGASRSSWSQYVDLAEGICETDIILGQFKSIQEYKNFAEASLADILEHKTLRKDFELMLLES